MIPDSTSQISRIPDSLIWGKHSVLVPCSVADPGEAPGGGGPPPLFVDQTEARRAEKFFFREPPPFPLSKGLDDPPPPPPHPVLLVCQSIDRLIFLKEAYETWEIYTSS